MAVVASRKLTLKINVLPVEKFKSTCVKDVAVVLL